MKRLYLPAFALLLATCAFAVSSNDAVNTVITSNHFVYEGETYTPPNVAIEYEDKSYWVIPVTAGQNVVTYFPVEAQTGQLSSSRATNRGLFGLADGLRELQRLKGSISSNSGVEWIFTQTYQSFFNEMALELSDGVYKLNTVESTLKSSGVEVDVSALRVQLNSLSSDAAATASKISAATQAENAFVTEPSSLAFSALSGSFGEVFDSISQMQSQSLIYKSDLDKLKQQISVANTDAQTKQQLFALLEMPSQLSSLRSYSIYSTQIKGSIDSAFSASSVRLDSLLAEFDNRILKNESYGLIFGENEKIRKETGFLSLAEAKSAILAKESRQAWENQLKVRELEQDYSRASKFYDERNFVQAKKSAQSAIENAVSVYKAGRKKEAAPAGISQDLLFKVAGILVVLLALLYLFNNRGKLKGALTSQPEGVDIYG
ncbi:MAG TPA: hypothetical protein HA254_00910 [Candidatus Diapherotrites archaeon]|uniref:Uncharacterized protein n=1 Tax=Candidatus Iainarchaeum sp. TaxID=3101447 RepID=A0A7J4IY79_9ARCH|nr:hypothetical protein [Candidatus Diapherotrites archaeon]